jgi:diguanylate cyclase (GGDEF)-like protein
VIAPRVRCFAVMSVDRLVASLDHLPGTSVLLLDSDYTILWASASSYDVFGLRPSDAVGRSAFEFIHPDDLDAVATDLIRVIEHAEADLEVNRWKGGGAHIELHLKGAHGWVRTTMLSHVLFAVDGAESLLLFAWRSPDAVLLDEAIDAIGHRAPLDDILTLVLRYVETNFADPRTIYRLVRWDGRHIQVYDGTGPRESDAFVPADLVSFVRTVTETTDFVDGSGLPPEVARVGVDAGRPTLSVVPIFEPGSAVPAGAVVLWDVAGMSFARIKGIPAAVRLAGVAMSVDRATRELFDKASRDGLTGVLNHDAFRTALARADDEREPCAVLVVDVDDFKTVNDTLGHQIGDAVLATAAKRLGLTLREHDVVARLGGDEFAALLPAIESVEDAMPIAQRVVDALCTAMHLGDVMVHVSCSVGVAVRQSGEALGDVLGRADLALYDAKAAGKGVAAVRS